MADIAKKRVQAREARHARARKKVSGTAERPRLCVRRSLKNVIVQIIDDTAGKSLVQVATSANTFRAEHGKLTRIEQSKEIGKLIAEKAKEKGIASVVFDRGGYIYHGRVKAVAEGAREAGLEF